MKNLIAISVVLIVLLSCKKENTTAELVTNQHLECVIDSIPWSASNSLMAYHNGDYLTVIGKDMNGGSIEIRVSGPLQKGAYMAGVSNFIVYTVDTYDHEIFHTFDIVQSYIEIKSIEGGIVTGSFSGKLSNPNGSKILKDGEFRVQLRPI